jgi:hypothetical protein
MSFTPDFEEKSSKSSKTGVKEDRTEDNDQVGAGSIAWSASLHFTFYESLNLMHWTRQLIAS